MCATIANMSDDLEKLRYQKGVDFTGISVIFFCYNDQGQIFLAKRSNKARDEHGCWAPGAGGLEHGQSAEDNMLRELAEEFGGVSLGHEFIGYFDVFRKAADGSPTHWIALCYAVKVDPTQISIKEPELVDDSGWFTVDNLPQPEHSQFKLFLELHGDKLKGVVTRK
jgi:8-oxo-dGTP diphosphatase